MKRTIIITISVIIVALILLGIFNKVVSKKDTSDLFAETIQSDFEISVTSSGELVAENSIEIKAPEITQERDIHATSIKIQDLVPEGTEVQEGDYIATLDRTEFDNNLKDGLERLATFKTNIEIKTLDTAVMLTNLRDEIRNQKQNVEEAAITFRNSKYEPPTAIRQAEIDLDKQKRILEQRERTYILRCEQAKNELRHLNMWYARGERRVKDFEEILAGFVIKAPSPGMVIYKKDRRGNKIKTGSSISTFERVVATLPDLSSMLSRIFVSEIEISKVKPGQKVNVNVDAFPAKTYNGEILSVANIGEKLPNTDSKVFEVLIKIEGYDPTLRPSMTTGNKITIKSLKDVIFIPTECVHTEADGIPFVYTKNKTKQIIVPGESNEKHIIIEKGLKPGTLVYLAQPDNFKDFKFHGEELATLITAR